MVIGLRFCGIVVPVLECSMAAQALYRILGLRVLLRVRYSSIAAVYLAA